MLILHGLAPGYEEHHACATRDDAIRAAVELSARYISDRFLPDKAIDLIDQAGARLRLRLGAKRRRDGAAERAARSSRTTRTQAVAAEELRGGVPPARRRAIAAIQRASSRRRRLGASDGVAMVDEEEIAEVIARATGIPASRLTEGDRDAARPRSRTSCTSASSARTTP